jgi:predicted nucleic acid-binding Zn ribbon protein
MDLAGAWRSLVDDRGWVNDLRGAAIIGRWPDIVGPVNAEHVQPESFDPESGMLLVRTSSAAWAEQLRLMLPALRAAVDATVGPGLVRDIRIQGPTSPRPRGRLRVRGRGRTG